MSEIEFSDIQTTCFEKKKNGGDYKRQIILTLNKTQLHEIFRNSNIILTIVLKNPEKHCNPIIQ